MLNKNYSWWLEKPPSHLKKKKHMQPSQLGNYATYKLRGGFKPPQCHVRYPQEVAGLIKGPLNIGFP